MYVCSVFKTVCIKFVLLQKSLKSLREAPQKYVLNKIKRLKIKNCNKISMQKISDS